MHIENGVFLKENSKNHHLDSCKFMASSPIISWQIEGEKMEAVADFLFLDSKLSVDGDCSHESRKTIASWKENDDKPRRCVEKQRHHC